MAARVLICGPSGADRFAQLLERGGCVVTRTRAFPETLPADCDAVVLAPDAEGAESAAPVARALAAGPRAAGQLLAVLLPPGISGELLVATGVDECDGRPVELAARLIARMLPATRAGAAVTLADVLALSAAADFEGCARGVLETAQRLTAAGAPALFIDVSGMRGRLLRLGAEGLVDEEAEGVPEAEIAVAKRAEALLSAGDARAGSALQAGFAVAAPLIAGRTCLGALTLRLPGSPTAEEIGGLRRLAALAAAPLAVHLFVAAGDGSARADDRYGELLEANRRLREEGHGKDEQLALAAQELRAPLGAVLSRARVLLDAPGRPLTPEAQRELEALLRHARRAHEIVEALLDHRALASGEMQLMRSPVDLAALVREVCEAAGDSARERDVHLERRLPEQPAVLELDGSRLRRALTNLLFDAIAATASGRALEISLQSDEESGALLRVRTRAPSGEEAASVPVMSRLGFGLGFAAAREVVERHGGTVASGGANLLEIRLPAGRPAASVASAVARRRPLVLVVEDDRDEREALCELLGDAYDVVSAEDGERGAALARERLPDLIVLDLLMPRLDGFAAMEDLRRDRRTGELPVIVVSGESSESLKVRALEIGAADYLSKPYSVRELLARMDRTLRMTRQRDALRALAQTDALTGLPNFRAFHARLGEELKRSRRYRTPLACVMFDLDDFKGINDRLGHGAGNRALATIASVLQEELRETDFAARFGGDEFVVLLPHTSRQDAAVFAERLRQRIAGRAVDNGEDRMTLRASFGVAAIEEGESELGEDLQARADAALYEAKDTGRDRVVVAAPPGPPPVRTHA